jgi:outer membrane protein OmpA-like peptidoglycan-associated protein
MNGRDDEPGADARDTTVLLALFAALVAALVGMFGPHDGSVTGAPRALEARIEAALSQADLQGLDVVMHGQRASLYGIVNEEGRIAEARHLALTAAGPGGAWAGGVTSVDASGVSVGAFDQPYTWGARREGDGVVLTGAAPSAYAREAIQDMASRAFATASPVNSMHIAGGAPSADFTDLALTAIRILARLNSGEVRIIDDQIVVIGDGGQAAVDAAHEAFAAPPAPYSARLALTIDGLDVEHPELQGLNLVNGDAETCAQAFDRLMERNVINFEPGSAEIDVSSQGVLGALATVALRCDRFQIEVAGHTDNEGGRPLNMDLSQRRADAVASYLISQGVSQTRVSARGYGPDRPRADNATEEGRASNRRIEFNVSG